MSYKKPSFIPDVIQDLTATPWGRLFTETPLYKPPEDEKYRLGMKVGWPSAKSNNQEQIQQSLLEQWPDLFDDMEKSAVELERLGRENYDAILDLARCNKTPGDNVAQALIYATAMAMVIVAQRELLATVMPNIRKDTERGYNTVAKAAEEGRDGQQKLREKRAKDWKLWEQEINSIRQKHPDWSQRNVARYVAQKCGGNAETIRKHMQKHKERLSF